MKHILFIVSLIGIFGCVRNVEPLKVMSYNIRLDAAQDSMNRWDLRKASMVELFNKYNPCIIGIQEGLPHQVRYLDSALANYAYVGVGRDDGKNEGEFSAIFFDSTSITVKNSSTFWLSESPDSVSYGWDAACRRICTYGLFQNNETNEQFWVFNTHFDHVGTIAREKSAELIFSKIRELNTANLPVVLMGDFNCNNTSKPIQIINSFLDDSYAISDILPIGQTGTFNGFNDESLLEERIDYIFVTGFNVIRHSHINDKRADGYFISDHLPVLVELTLLSN